MQHLGKCQWIRYALFAGIIIASISYGICIATFKVFPYDLLHDGYSSLILRSHAVNTEQVYLTTNASKLITIKTMHDVDIKRAALIKLIWSGDGFPTTVPQVNMITGAIPISGISSLDNRERVDTFTVAMDYGINSTVYVVTPLKKNGVAVIYASGHEGNDPTLGRPELIEDLIKHGFTVAVIGMPLIGDNPKPNVSIPNVGDFKLTHHNQLALLQNQTLYPVVFFMHPLALTTNYLANKYDSIVMMGLSGGGWETTFYSAIDSRIQHSYPVAGSLPLYLRSQPEWGDYEQIAPELYRIVNYLDLYVMGAAGNRSQLQILNRYDSCCFAGDGYKTYESAVAQAAVRLNGSFAVYSDNSTVHRIAQDARSRIVLELLNIYPNNSQ